MPPDVLEEIGRCFECYARAGGMLSLEEAFGLKCSEGRKPWFVILARERRDRAIRALGERTTGCTAKKIDTIRATLRRHRRAWQNRSLLGMDNSEKRLAFEIFDAADAGDGVIPESPDHLRKIISGASD